MGESAPSTEAAGRGRELFTSRVIPAPRERVFQAFADPDQLAAWWGPNGFTNTFEEFDLRPGGRWRLVMHGPDGREFPNESLFEEVAPPERVILRHASKPHFTLAITLREEGEGTRVEWRQRFVTAEECRRIATFAVAANEQNLDRLTEVVLGRP